MRASFQVLYVFNNAFSRGFVPIATIGTIDSLGSKSVGPKSVGPKSVVGPKFIARLGPIAAAAGTMCNGPISAGPTLLGVVGALAVLGVAVALTR